MPRRCTVCDHANRADIDRALVSRSAPFRAIARQFGLHRDALMRHDAAHLPVTLAKAAEAEDAARADGLLAELGRVREKVTLILDARDAWLRDPDGPSRYDVGPRAGDVAVTYTAAAGDGKVERRKRRLSELLDMIAASPAAPPGFGVRLVEVKHEDPRRLILRATAELRGYCELLARVEGKIKSDVTVNVLTSPEWAAVRSTIIAALAPFPAARVRVAEALAAMAPADAARN